MSMSKTMVANITGARLREVERELALLRGEEVVTQYLEAHPHETRVLQYLVEQRRAGRSAPALARIQRAMVWSDGTIELKTLPASAPARHGDPARSSRDRAARPARQAPSGGARTTGRSSQPLGTAAPGRRRPGAARPGRRGSEAEPDLRSLPRAGEGWALLRPGEPPPSPPEDLSPAVAAETAGTEQEAEAAGAGKPTT